MNNLTINSQKRFAFLSGMTRSFPPAAKAIALICLLFFFADHHAWAKERPNIVFILTDDMGYGDVGCYGGKFVPTPNVDQLAKEGTRFTQFYVAAPVCSPSRTGFLTGNFPARWKITNFLQTREGNRKSEQADFLDPKAPSIARTLKAAGYVTGHFGKWHMGGGRDVTNAPPFSAYGFDEHVSTYESPEPDPIITATNWIWSADDKVKRWDRTAYFVDKTLEFLKRHKGEPCYVNLWPDDVHTPWVPEGSDLTRRRHPENRSTFGPVLAEYDKQIGRFMDGLKHLGLDKDTIVIFTSDNGPLPTMDRARSAGLRGAKDSLYEGGTGEPFIVRWPGHAPAGRVDETSVINGVDFFPTFCKLTGTALPKNVEFDGEDVSQVFFGKSLMRKKPMFWEYGRNETFGYPKEYPGQSSPNVAVREGKWKLLVNADGSQVELYDINADRNEAQNVAEKNPKLAKRLMRAALDWRKSLP
jgi:arylsulfatase A-like enzyme